MALCAAALSVPLFSAGRLRFELRLAEVRESSAVVAYDRPNETAFREMANGRAGGETFAVQFEAPARTVASAVRPCPACVSLRDPGGTSNFSMHGQLYAARQAPLDLRRSAFGNAVARYKALGGGLMGAEPSRAFGRRAGRQDGSRLGAPSAPTVMCSANRAGDQPEWKTTANWRPLALTQCVGDFWPCRSS